MSEQLIQLTRPQVAPAGWPPAERRKLEQQARRLAWGGVGYHVLEAAVAVGAGLAAGSIALIGFGADSLIESVAVWGKETRFRLAGAGLCRFLRRRRRAEDPGSLRSDPTRLVGPGGGATGDGFDRRAGALGSGTRAPSGGPSRA
jgi:hypothetical protein